MFTLFYDMARPQRVNTSWPINSHIHQWTQQYLFQIMEQCYVGFSPSLQWFLHRNALALFISNGTDQLNSTLEWKIHTRPVFHRLMPALPCFIAEKCMHATVFVIYIAEQFLWNNESPKCHSFYVFPFNMQLFQNIIFPCPNTYQHIQITVRLHARHSVWNHQRIHGLLNGLLRHSSKSHQSFTL